MSHVLPVELVLASSWYCLADTEGLRWNWVLVLVLVLVLLQLLQLLLLRVRDEGGPQC
jgi:hypothetical protein